MTYFQWFTVFIITETCFLLNNLSIKIKYLMSRKTVFNSVNNIKKILVNSKSVFQ